MAGKKVYVIWTHPLFHESIRLLLKEEAELVGSSDDHAFAVQEITKIMPDVVIIERPKGLKELNQETLSILQMGPKVIHLSLEDNELSMYIHQHRTMDQPKDLVQMILSTRDEVQIERDQAHE